MREMRDSAAAWLSENGHRIVWEHRSGHVVIGAFDRSLVHPMKPIRSDELGEIAVVLVTGGCVYGGSAQARLTVERYRGPVNLVGRWKRRKPGRWITVFHTRDVSPEQLVLLRDFDQQVSWPRQSYYPAHTQSPPSLGN